MSLGTKINIILVSVTTIVLTIAFWIIVNIEATAIKQQVMNDSGAIVDIMRGDVERMLAQVRSEQYRLQAVVDKLSVIEGVKYVNVAGADGYYLASTDHDINGKKAPENSLLLLEKSKTNGNIIDTKSDRGSFYELKRHTPVYLSDEGGASSIISVVEIAVATRSKSAGDVIGGQKLLQSISASIEQNARSIVLLRNDDIKAIQKFTDEMLRFGFYQKLTVLDGKFNVIANTGGVNTKLEQVSGEYKQIREDVLSGIKQDASVELTDEGGNNIIMRVVPIVFTVNGISEHGGLLEAHILTSAYKDKINALKIRMVGIGIVLTAVLVIVIAGILRREVVEPITLYSRVAQKVSDGDLDQKIEHVSGGEIGRFGDVFNSMVANLREFDRMKSDFLSVAAHQLRTPLSGVKWVLKLLLDGDLGPMTDDQRGMLNRGYETNEKMIQLVNDLLNVSRIESRKFGYKIEENDFEQVLKALVENLELAARARQVEIHVENHAGVIPPFFFDSERLLIALQNIVDNAVKYTLPGGHVTIRIERKGDYLHIRVTDTGVGIPKAEISKLFSKFFRASNVIHLQTDGSGLGLFIVKNIILRHRGQVWVDSVEGKGTTFTVVIPIATEPTDPAQSLPAA